MDLRCFIPEWALHICRISASSNCAVLPCSKLFFLLSDFACNSGVDSVVKVFCFVDAFACCMIEISSLAFGMSVHLGRFISAVCE